MSKYFNVLIINKLTNELDETKGRQLDQFVDCIVVKLANGWTVRKDWRTSWDCAVVNDSNGRHITSHRISM